MNLTQKLRWSLKNGLETGIYARIQLFGYTDYISGIVQCN